MSTTLRARLEAIDKLSDPLPKTQAEAFDRLCLIAEEVESAIAAIDACNVPDTWKAEGQGVQSADYRCRILPDPKPGEPDPWAPA